MLRNCFIQKRWSRYINDGGQTFRTEITADGIVTDVYLVRLTLITVAYLAEKPKTTLTSKDRFLKQEDDMHELGEGNRKLSKYG